MELRALPWHEAVLEAELARTKILVNATSIGLAADETPVPAAALPSNLLVLDLIYRRTRLLAEAEAAGRYPLPSSLLMNAIPARAAGVDEVIVCCPRPDAAVFAAAIEARVPFAHAFAHCLSVRLGGWKGPYPGA